VIGSIPNIKQQERYWPESRLNHSGCQSEVERSDLRQLLNVGILDDQRERDLRTNAGFKDRRDRCDTGVADKIKPRALSERKSRLASQLVMKRKFAH
jgi:hypothetical protein